MARERMAAPSHADALLDDTHQWMESRPPLASASAVAVTRSMAPEVPTGQSLTDTTAKPSTWGNRIKRLRSSKEPPSPTPTERGTGTGRQRRADKTP